MFEPQLMDDAMRIVRETMPPTPQQRWPLLDQRVGAQVWVKHENHTAVGAFKLRGGLVYFDGLRRREPEVRGVVTATRGNHGQSVGFAARRHGLQATVVVPHGNSVEKNAAMRALGVATYWVEFFESFAPGYAPEAVFVPIGLGSGICACAAARAHVGASTRIIGVVSAHATAYQQPFREGRSIEAPATTQLADGMACRLPD